jgi:hypothetical protein
MAVAAEPRATEVAHPDAAEESKPGVRRGRKGDGGDRLREVID